jgi:RimJ/RimL family protein N-acetyltransferase
MLTLLNEPSFIRNIGDRGVLTIDQAIAYIEQGPVASYARFGFGLFLVVVKETAASIGICGLIKREELDDVDIGFAFLPAYWAQGYALESARAVERYARSVARLRRLVAITSPDNQGSIRVLEKIGLRFEKTIRLAGDGPELKLFVSAWPAPHLDVARRAF